MTKNRQDYHNRTKGYMELDNEVQVEEDVIAHGLDTAADHHSIYRPHIRMHEITGDASNRYDLPEHWEEGFSLIRHIEYPVGEDDPVLIDPEDALVWYTPELKLQFKGTRINAGESALMQYTSRHILSSEVVTVPDHEFEAVCILAAHHAAMEIAGRFIKDHSEALSRNTAGIVNFRHVSDLFKNYAQELFKLYCKRIGISTDEPTVQPHLQIFDLDPEPIYGGDYLTHTSPFRRRNS